MLKDPTFKLRLAHPTVPDILEENIGEVYTDIFEILVKLSPRQNRIH